MFEYASVSASAYDVSSLVGKLNERASDGWEVVSIVPTGGDVTAILKRTAAQGTNGEGAAADAETVVGEAVMVDAGTAPMSEPAGWAAEPSTSSTTTEEPASEWSAAGAGAGAAAAANEWSGSTTTEPEPPTTTPERQPEPVAAPPAAASVPTTPAGWYPDPSGRYEMRYWDGDKWTEHVSRQGQTYTDPPVA
jgi:hypothetical protein